MTYVQSFSAVTPPPRYDAVAWTDVEIRERSAIDGIPVLIDTQSIPIDPTPATPNAVTVTTTLATLPAGYYDFRFKDTVPNYSNYSAPVLAPALAAFATPGDVAWRLGRDLTTAEETQTELLLHLATGLITEAVGKTDAWAAALTPIPDVLKAIAIESTVRVLRNPAGVDSQTEALGAYSHTERFAIPTVEAVGLMLTDMEERRARRAVYGKNNASSRAETLGDHLARSVYDAQIVVLTDADPDTTTV